MAIAVVTSTAFWRFMVVHETRPTFTQAPSCSGGLRLAEATLYQPKLRLTGRGSGMVLPSQRRPRVTMKAGFVAASKMSKKAAKQQAKKAAASPAVKVKERKTKEGAIEIDGTVVSHIKNFWTVKLVNGFECRCTLAGKLRQNSIRVLEGDLVTVELSPSDLESGRIVFRRIDKKALDKRKEEEESG